MFGTREHAESIRDEVAAVDATIGLRLAKGKTHTVHIDDGFDFLGFRIQRHSQWGSSRRRIYFYPSAKSVKTVRARTTAQTGRQAMNMDPALVFIRLGQTVGGWTTFFRHGASKIAFSDLEHDLWHRVWTMAMPSSPATALEMDRPHVRAPSQPVGIHGERT